MSLNLDFISSEFNLNVVGDSGRVVYLFEEYRLDVARRMLYRGEREMVLPPKAIETLIALIDHRGEIVSKADLMKIIWGDTIVEESNLDHYLHVLRKALGEKSNGQSFIETLRRRGYRFTPAVRVIETSERNGKLGVRPDSNPFQLNEDLNGSQAPVAESLAATPVQVIKPLRFSPVLGAIAVLAGLLGSVVIWYLQRQDLSTPAKAWSPRGELKVVPLTNGNAVLSATISPDGRYFAYHEATTADKQQLWLQQVGQSVRIDITPPGEWWINYKTFSPNAEFLYFVGREKRDDRESLYRVATLGGEWVKILTGIDSPVSFSPDGRKISFIRFVEKESHLITAGVDGEAEKVLLSRSGNERLSIGNAWSPDGKFIAYERMDSSSSTSEGTCSFEAVDVYNLSVKDLSPERWDTCFRMAWTPDGKGLVFIGTRIAESYTLRRDQVYYLSIDERRSYRISPEGSRYQAASLGLTGDNALLVVPHRTISQIWAMDAGGDSRTAVQMTNGQRDGPAGIATLPDGRVGYISRLGEELTIWVMSSDGSNQYQIDLQLPIVEQLESTPDGQYFVFSARRDGFSHLYRVNVTGQDLKQLTHGENYEIAPAISPDSKWVYYVSHSRPGDHSESYLRKTSIDGSQTVELAEVEASYVPELSPDGKLIATVLGGKLCVFSSSDGKLISSSETDKLSEPWGPAKWTPDGRLLTYLVYRENTVNIWAQSPGGSAPRPLTNFPKGYIYSYAFSRDGTKLYVARGYQIREAALMTGL